MARRKLGDPPIVGEGLCLCGCGMKPVRAKSLFVMGHDARLKSVAIKVAKGLLDEKAINDAQREWAIGHGVDFTGKAYRKGASDATLGKGRKVKMPAGLSAQAQAIYKDHVIDDEIETID